jgi:hypothetical protein
MVTAIIILLSLCSGTCVIRYAKGIGIFFGLYRMSEYSCFIDTWSSMCDSSLQWMEQKQPMFLWMRRRQGGLYKENCPGPGNLEYRQVRSRSKDWKTSWSNIRYAQSQKIEKHPGVTSGTLKVNRLKSVPDVTPGCFSICWLWAYPMLLQDVFQSFDFERTWRYSRMFLKTSWSNVRYAQSQKIEKHPGVTSGTLKVNRLKNILE